MIPYNFEDKDNNETKILTGDCFSASFLEILYATYHLAQPLFELKIVPLLRVLQEIVNFVMRRLFFQKQNVKYFSRRASQTRIRTINIITIAHCTAVQPIILTNRNDVSVPSIATRGREGANSHGVSILVDSYTTYFLLEKFDFLKLLVAVFDAASKTETPSAFTAFTCAPLSTSMRTIFSNPVKDYGKR